MIDPPIRSDGDDRLEDLAARQAERAERDSEDATDAAEDRYLEQFGWGRDQ